MLFEVLFDGLFELAFVPLLCFGDGLAVCIVVLLGLNPFCFTVFRQNSLAVLYQKRFLGPNQVIFFVEFEERWFVRLWRTLFALLIDNSGVDLHFFPVIL